MEQKNSDELVLKIVAAIAENLPPLKEEDINFLVNNPLVLRQKLLMVLAPDRTEEQEAFLNAPIDSHWISGRVVSCCRSVELKSLKPLMSISRSNPPREYKLFYKKLAVRPMKELVDLFAKHGLTLPE